MFPIKPETISQQNSSSSLSTRSPFFSFTMGPLTIYPLFLLPLIFWISPISSTSIASSSVRGASEDPAKDHRLHTGYAQQTSIDSEFEDVEDKPYNYANTPLNLQNQQHYQQQHDLQNPQHQQQNLQKYYQSSPMSYYPNMYGYQNQMFGYPNLSPYQSAAPPQLQPSYPFVNINPYMSQSPYLFAPNNYQSQVYDPYLMLMQMGQSYPEKLGSYSTHGLLPQSPQISSMLTHSPRPNHLYQSIQPNSYPFYPQAKPLPSETQQLLNNFQNDPQSIINSYLPSGSSHMLYSSMSDPTSLQSTIGQGHQLPSQMGYQPPSSSTTSSSVLSSISAPDPQQIMASVTSQLPQKPSTGLSPPFGYIDKQVRHPNDDPSEIVRKPPPKAIMTTAADLLGLRAGGHQPHTPFSFHYSPDKNKQTLHKYGNKNGPSQSQYKRKPPVFSFNNINNNKQFSFDHRFMPAGLDLQVPKNEKLKTFNNATQVPCEDCAEPTFISEPIMPNSVLSLPNWEMIDEVMAKSKKQAKPEEAHNILPHDDNESSDGKEHAPELNIQDQDRSADPIPLFVTGDEEDMYFAQKDTPQNDPTFPFTKAQIYRCPSSRDLTNMSQIEIFPDPLRCNQFYYCRNSTAYVFRCPINHVFNPFTNICERDEDFACSMTLKK